MLFERQHISKGNNGHGKYFSLGNLVKRLGKKERPSRFASGCLGKTLNLM